MPSKDEKPAELSHEQEVEIVAATMGERLTGEVESLKPFGAFIKLPNGQTGLLHISQCGFDENVRDRTHELYRRFQPHTQVEVLGRSSGTSRRNPRATIRSRSRSMPSSRSSRRCRRYGGNRASRVRGSVCRYT